MTSPNPSQTSLSEVDFQRFARSDADRYGYDEFTTALHESEVDPETFVVGLSDVERLVLRSNSSITERLAGRLIDRFGSYDAVVDVAQAGTDEDGCDELVSVPGVSTRMAAAFRRELCDKEGGDRE